MQRHSVLLSGIAREHSDVGVSNHSPLVPDEFELLRYPVKSGGRNDKKEVGLL